MLIIKTVLQGSPSLEVGIEIVNVAPDELTVGIRHWRGWVGSQECGRLPAIRCEQPGRVVSQQARNNVARKKRRIVESNAAANHAAAIQ